MKVLENCESTAMCFMMNMVEAELDLPLINDVVKVSLFFSCKVGSDCLLYREL